MNTSTTPLLVALMLALTVSCEKKPVPPPSKPVVTDADTAIMDEPDAEVAHRFGRVIAVSELPDGRLIVIDDKNNAVVRADVISPTVTVLGHAGSGAGEYNHPSGLLTHSGDTLWVIDSRNARFDIITPQGEMLPRSVALPKNVPVTLSAADRHGQLYATAMVSGTDSVQLLRFDSVATHADSVVRLKGSPGAGGTSPDLTALRYPDADGWDVSPDGDVMIVRTQPYHAEVVTALGARTVGPVSPFSPIAVPDSGRAASGGLPTKPPFYATVFEHPRAAPNGTLWVRRTTADDAGLATYDVFDRSATVTRHVVLHPNSRIVGFSTKYVYVVMDSTDGQSLRRYYYPRP